MARQIKTPALRFVCESPPEPFEEDFPLVAEYLMLHAVDEDYDIICVYVPEDAQFFYREEALKFIMTLAPITTFSGGVEATITFPEED